MSSWSWELHIYQENIKLYGIAKENCVWEHKQAKQCMMIQLEICTSNWYEASTEVPNKPHEIHAWCSSLVKLTTSCVSTMELFNHNMSIVLFISCPQFYQSSALCIVNSCNFTKVKLYVHWILFKIINFSKVKYDVCIKYEHFLCFFAK